MTTETTPLPAESTHFYFKDGRPCYEVPRAKGDGMRPTTIADARKLDLVPSYSEIAKVAAKPGLIAWYADHLLDSALTLPIIEGELADDRKKRIIADADAKSQKARDKGTQLHAAIEAFIRGDQPESEFALHCVAVSEVLRDMGILLVGNAEHSFASPLGYGGKIDFHNDEPLIIDFKTKERIDDKKQLAWPEHIQQLAAYGFGLWFDVPRFRCLNVFVGILDKQVRVLEYEWPDIVEAFAQFRCLLEYWQRCRKFGPYAK